MSAAAKSRKHTSTTNTAEAFGSVFYLTPSFCLRMHAEEARLFNIASSVPGLAILTRSEMQPTARLVELIGAERSGSGAASLLSAEALFCSDSCRLLHEPNAGGASRISEAMSCEVLSRAFNARLEQTELEIRYWPSNGAMTDFTVSLDGCPLGVSVTRAITAKHKVFDIAAASSLLKKKLSGVLRSTETCCGAWERQILHIWSPNISSANALEVAYAQLPEDLRADTTILITVCEGLRVLFEETSSNKASTLARCPKVKKGQKDEAHLRVLQDSDPLRLRMQHNVHFPSPA